MAKQRKQKKALGRPKKTTEQLLAKCFEIVKELEHLKETPVNERTIKQKKKIKVLLSYSLRLNHRIENGKWDQ